jgi:hypothetical protein
MMTPLRHHHDLAKDEQCTIPQRRDLYFNQMRNQMVESNGKGQSSSLSSASPGTGSTTDDSGVMTVSFTISLDALSMAAEDGLS